MAAQKKKSIRTVGISEFRVKCLSLLDQVNKTKIPVRVTRRGKPIADVVPAEPAPDKQDWIGSMADSFEIAGDIISPVLGMPGSH